jgi:hypothetical protein
MTITSAGNVGIGSTTANAKLDVNSTYVSDTTTQQMFRDNTGGGLLFGGTGGAAKWLQAQDYTGAATYYNLLLNPRGGFVGIGVTPANTLHVRSTVINDWSVYFENAVTFTGLPIYGILNNFATSPNSVSSYFMYSADSTTQRFSVRANGGIYNFQANDSNLSDERTKKDIALLESYWDKFKAIEIVKFKYKDQTHDDYNIGVIAQQVEKVAPEFVDIDGWEKAEFDEEGNQIIVEEPLKSIYTSDMYHAAIKVLQEAMAKIEELQARLDNAGL